MPRFAGDPYAALHVSEDASDDAIDAAFQTLLIRWERHDEHSPDFERFARASDARAPLNPRTRAEYDRQRDRRVYDPCSPWPMEIVRSGGAALGITRNDSLGGRGRSVLIAAGLFLVVALVTPDPWLRDRLVALLPQPVPVPAPAATAMPARTAAAEWPRYGAGGRAAFDGPGNESEIRVGNCVPAPNGLPAMHATSCDAIGAVMRVMGIFLLPLADPYPDSATFLLRAYTSCPRTSESAVHPSREARSAGDRRVICLERVPR